MRYDDNGNGRISCAEARAHGIMAGTVLAPGIWWNKHSADGRNVNQLTPQDETDMGASGSFYDVRVFVEAVWVEVVYCVFRRGRRGAPVGWHGSCLCRDWTGPGDGTD